MKSNMALAVSLAAVLVGLLAVPAPAAFAATIEADIVSGALNKSTDAYSPNPIEANVGDTIVWTNKDSTLHTVSSGSAADPTHIFGDDASGNPKYIGPNQKFEHTFEEEGEFPYYCTLHPAMVGTVVVGAGGGGNGEPQQSSAEAEHDGQTYTVTAMSADTSVTAVEINPGQSVQVEFEGAGEVELTLPKSMISGNLMVNGQAAEVVSDDAQSTTISLTVPESGAVEITGATVIPEFGVIAALVLAASLVAVIGVARFKGSSFGLGRF
jgi:predicted secreted protein with PEFG-CTERM motif